MEPSRHFSLATGDLLFQDLVGSGADAIEAVTPGYHGAEVSHMAMYTRVGHHPYVIEAFPPEVRLTPLPVFLRRALDDQNRPRVFVGRLIEKYRPLVPGAVKKALELRGLPYDAVYLTGEDAYYCSELIVDAFKYANNGIALFPEHPMSFRDPATGEILDYWKRYYAHFGREVPDGQPGSNPGEISMSDKLEIVHRYGYLTNWH